MEYAMEIQGFCDDRFESVRDAFEENFQKHGDVGASFAATVEGEFVVDLWGGHRDAKRSLPWEENTIVNAYSISKTMTFLCVLLLEERGELAFDAPVSRYCVTVESPHCRHGPWGQLKFCEAGEAHCTLCSSR